MVLGPTARKLLPYLNFTIASAALAFQTTVLYPWHHELDAAFHRLKAEQTAMLKEFHEVKLKRIEELERKVLGLEVGAQRAKAQITFFCAYSCDCAGRPDEWLLEFRDDVERMEEDLKIDARLPNPRPISKA